MKPTEKVKEHFDLSREVSRCVQFLFSLIDSYIHMHWLLCSLLKIDSSSKNWRESIYSFWLIHQPKEVSKLAKHIYQLIFILDFFPNLYNLYLLHVCRKQKRQNFHCHRMIYGKWSSILEANSLTENNFPSRQILLQNTNFKKMRHTKIDLINLGDNAKVWSQQADF